MSAASASSSSANKPHPLLAFYLSSIGKKWIVALTGLALLGFVTGHLVGNLQIFLPPVWINSYALHLENLGPLLWVIRLSLLGIIGLHIITTVQLTAHNRASRPASYAVKKHSASTLASRSMILSGLVILSFVIFHILHYTVRLKHPEWSVATFPIGHGAETEMVRDVHKMMIEGFSSLPVTAFYILSVFLLSLHLSHGISSSLQTLGLNSRKLECGLRLIGRGYAWALFAGYASIPTAIFLGLVKP